MPEQTQSQLPSFAALLPGSPQISGALDRLLWMALTWAATEGYITSADILPYALLIIGAGGVAWSVITNRRTNLALRAAAVPGTTVITTPAIAAATPQADNILSNTKVEAVQK